jgi:hypothetical protein
VCRQPENRTRVTAPKTERVTTSICRFAFTNCLLRHISIGPNRRKLKRFFRSARQRISAAPTRTPCAAPEGQAENSPGQRSGATAALGNRTFSHQTRQDQEMPSSNRLGMQHRHSLASCPGPVRVSPSWSWTQSPNPPQRCIKCACPLTLPSPRDGATRLVRLAGRGMKGEGQVPLKMKDHRATEEPVSFSI